MAKILLVEDDAIFAEGLIDALRRDTHVIDHAWTIAEGNDFIATYPYDVFVFDWDLPDGSGAKLCAQLVDKGTSVPIIMLTARSALESRVEGLDVGATDYVTKPCYPDELSARIRAILRRNTALESDSAPLQLGGLQLNSAARTVIYNDQPVPLSPTEFDILQVLFEQSGKPITPDSIVSRCARGLDSKLSRSSLKVYMSGIRKKLAAAAATTITIESTEDGYVIRL